MSPNPPNYVGSSDEKTAKKLSSSPGTVCGGGSEACEKSALSCFACSEKSALSSFANSASASKYAASKYACGACSGNSAPKFSKEPRVPHTLTPLFEDSTYDNVFLTGVPTQQVLLGTEIRNLEDGYEKLVSKLRRFGKVRAISIVGKPSSLRLAVQYKTKSEAQAAFQFFDGSEFARVTPLLDSQAEVVKFPYFGSSIRQLYKILMVMDFNIKKIFVVPEEPASKFVIFQDCSPHYVCEVLSSTAPLLGAVVERPLFAPLLVATTKILVGTFCTDLRDLYRRVVVMLHRFGSVRAMSVVGDAPRIRVAVQFAKTEEAQEALDFFDGSVFLCGFPSRLESHEETLKIRNFRGSVMQLFKFLVKDIMCDPIKVYLVPEEEYGHFVDLGYGSSAEDVRGVLSCTAPWLGAVVERPFFSRTAIDVDDLITGFEKRLSLVLVNVPRFFDRASFREEFSFRLWDKRSVTLEQLCVSCRMSYNKELKQNDGEVMLFFRNTECLLIFYEEFEGVHFKTLKSAQEDPQEAQEENSKEKSLKHEKCLQMYFAEHPNAVCP